MKRFCKYFLSVLSHGNDIVKYVFKVALYMPGSIISNNVKLICDGMMMNFQTAGSFIKVECECMQDVTSSQTAAFIRDLCIAREYSDTEMSNDDISEILEFLCTT